MLANTANGSPASISQRGVHHLQHNHPPLLDDSQKSEVFVSNGSSPAEAMNCLKNKCPNHHHQYRHRCVSVTSQATLLTTVSKNDVLNSSQSRIDQLLASATNGDSAPLPTTKFYRREERSALGSIAEKLRRGTRKIMLFTTTGSTSPSSSSPGHVSREPTTVIAATTRQRPPKLRKDNSIDSAHTNTISNSSLQEVDAEEFDSAELAKYMGVVNNEINTLKCSAGCIVPVLTSSANEGDSNPP